MTINGIYFVALRPHQMETAMKNKTLPIPVEMEDFDDLPLAERLRILEQLRDQHEKMRLAGQLPPPNIYFIQN